MTDPATQALVYTLAIIAGYYLTPRFPPRV